MKWPTYSMHTFVGGFNQILYLLGFHVTKHGNFGFDTFCYWGLATTHNLKEWIYYQGNTCNKINSEKNLVHVKFNNNC